MTAACAARVQRVYAHGPQLASSVSKSMVPSLTYDEQPYDLL